MLRQNNDSLTQLQQDNIQILNIKHLEPNKTIQRTHNQSLKN